ncbi:hypothetical protein D3C71_1258130 [compost metagenome]
MASACHHLIIRSVATALILILALSLGLILAPTLTQPQPHRFHTGQGYTVSAQL